MITFRVLVTILIPSQQAGMRVDAIMGEADGEDEKIIMIQSLRAMVDGLKMQIAADHDAMEAALQRASLLSEENERLKRTLSAVHRPAHMPLHEAFQRDMRPAPSDGEVTSLKEKLKSATAENSALQQQQRCEAERIKDASLVMAGEVNRLKEELRTLRALEESSAIQAASSQKQLEQQRNEILAFKVRAPKYNPHTWLHYTLQIASHYPRLDMFG